MFDWNKCAARRLAEAIARAVTRPWTIMEVCGGQTHTIVKYGIDEILPSRVELVHGPGCPVCVTSLEMIDRAHALASRPDATFCSFGDMLRVPGSRGDLLQLKSHGSDVGVVYSPLDAVNLATAHPERQVVFFAIGFETTAPANAMAVWMAHSRRLTNFTLLVSHVLVPPIITAILQAPGNRVQGFLGPGHVCTVMGTPEYEPIAHRYRVPIVVTGFEPLDLLEGVLRTVQQLEAGHSEVENQYARAVREVGNPKSKKLIDEVFDVCDRKWRGVGLIPKSGYKLRYEYHDHDAERRFEVADIETQESSECISGQILKASRNRVTALLSASSVRRSRPSARRWSRARALVLRTTLTGVMWRTGLRQSGVPDALWPRFTEAAHDQGNRTRSACRWAALLDLAEVPRKHGHQGAIPGGADRRLLHSPGQGLRPGRATVCHGQRRQLV